MIEIVLENGQTLTTDIDLDDAKSEFLWAERNTFATLGNCIVPIDKIMYIKAVDDDDL